MDTDWGYLAIVGVYIAAAFGYAFGHDGADPWTAAAFVSVLILIGKALYFMFGGDL